MGLRINQNIMALTAWRNLTITDNQLAKSIERLSSGMRINRASDDPAGFVTSENMRAQIEGITQAISNTTDAISMIQTAEGAFDEIEALLRSMRTLAVHAANTGPNDTAAIESDQAQIQNALESLDRIATTRKYGARYLLNGDLGKGGYTDTTSITFQAAGPKTLTTASLRAILGSTAGTIRATFTTTISRRSRLTAATVFGSTPGSLAQDEVLNINGIRIELKASMNITEAIREINNYKTQTGVEASAGAGATLILQSLNYGSDWTITVQTDKSNAEDRTSGFGGPNISSVGTDVAGFFVISSAGTDIATFIGYGNGQYLYAGKTVETINGVNVSLEGLKVRASLSAVNVSAEITISQPLVNFQVGANRGEYVQVGINNMRPDYLGLIDQLSNIDVRSAIGAQRAIQIIDEALGQVLDERGNIGAFQKNLLESTKNSLGIYRENLSAAESNIRDTDMALEMVYFTRHQILMQSGTAMLAQANLAPQSVLQLLR